MSTEPENWDPCPQGELTKTVQARTSQRRRKVIDRVAVVAATLMVLIAVGGYTLGTFTPEPPPGGRFGGLACTQVAELLPSYIAGETEAKTTENVAVHLKNCPHCQSRYEQLLSAVSSSIPVFALAWLV